MKTRKLAAALAIALAAGTAFAADDAAVANRTSTAASAQWFKAGEREQQSEEQKATLEHQGFPQYNP